ncbi:MAG: hypothetical protein M5U28_23280 [Sandaracinaceae bacterium]|nr:hypothetical protein [Sandaracinaceae bacterium]
MVTTKSTKPRPRTASASREAKAGPAGSEPAKADLQGPYFVFRLPARRQLGSALKIEAAAATLEESYEKAKQSSANGGLFAVMKIERVFELRPQLQVEDTKEPLLGE